MLHGGLLLCGRGRLCWPLAQAATHAASLADCRGSNHPSQAGAGPALRTAPFGRRNRLCAAAGSSVLALAVGHRDAAGEDIHGEAAANHDADASANTRRSRAGAQDDVAARALAASPLITASL